MSVTYLATSRSSVNHLPEDGQCRPKHVGVSCIYKTVVFLLLCACWCTYRSFATKVS